MKLVRSDKCFSNIETNGEKTCPMSNHPMRLSWNFYDELENEVGKI